ncbi:MAG: hypothetical protein KGJ02_03315 [Verrucomicrobiota bacterium]|nr:hypothetical protein [Verrucomicrobiota bacterium]
MSIHNYYVYYPKTDHYYQVKKGGVSERLLELYEISDQNHTEAWKKTGYSSAVCVIYVIALAIFSSDPDCKGVALLGAAGLFANICFSATSETGYMTNEAFQAFNGYTRQHRETEIRLGDYCQARFTRKSGSNSNRPHRA